MIQLHSLLCGQEAEKHFDKSFVKDTSGHRAKHLYLPTFISSAEREASILLALHKSQSQPRCIKLFMESWEIKTCFIEISREITCR